MEKLSLDKFKDCQIEEQQMSHQYGGGSSYTESCGTSTNVFGWTNDTQTDIYSDACDDGVYSHVCSYTTQRGIIMDSDC